MTSTETSIPHPRWHESRRRPTGTTLTGLDESRCDGGADQVPPPSVLYFAFCLGAYCDSDHRPSNVKQSDGSRPWYLRC